MSANFNQVILLGNVTRDVEMKYVGSSSTAVVNFGIAINRKYKDQEETTFVDCVAWGKQAETMSQYVSKGDPLFVTGRLTTDTWEDKDGNKRSKLKVTVEGFQLVKPKGAGGGKNMPPNPHTIPDDDAIPF